MKNLVLLGLVATTLVTACDQKATTGKTQQQGQAIAVSVESPKSKISLGRSKTPKLGDTVLEVGNPSNPSELPKPQAVAQPVQIAQNNRDYYDTLFDWGGVWKTTYGEMRLDQAPPTVDVAKVVGTYSTDSGLIDAVVYDGAVQGFWVETSSAQRCSTQKLGSYYWGGIYFQKVDANNFKGYWTYCDKPVGPRQLEGARSWTGTRQYPVASQPVNPPQSDVSRSGPSFRGEWQTSEGRMTLAWADHVTVTGTYSQDNGRIIGNSDDRRVLNGYWIENGSARRCSTQKDGSYYWGRIRFNLNSTDTEFTGKWSYCDDEPTSSWTGKRV